jgi:hypothetical protein
MADCTCANPWMEAETNPECPVHGETECDGSGKLKWTRTPCPGCTACRCQHCGGPESAECRREFRTFICPNYSSWVKQGGYREAEKELEREEREW